MNKKKVDSILKGITAAGIAMGGVSSIQGADMVMAAINESAADSNSLVDAGSLSESERTEYSESTTQSMSESASESTSESVSVSESSSASESAKQSDAEQQSGDNVVAAAYTDDAEQDIDYIEEDKAVWLTPKGVKFAESFFGISNFYGKENFEISVSD